MHQEFHVHPDPLFLHVLQNTATEKWAVQVDRDMASPNIQEFLSIFNYNT